MLDANTHRLLRRQIRNAEFSAEDLKKFKSFFDVVNEAYKNFDNDVNHIETILEKSSNELFRLNKALKSKVDNVEHELKTIVNSIDGVIFKTDMEGNFKYLNKVWEDFTGIKVENALEKKYREFLFGKNEKQKEQISRFLKNPTGDYNTLFQYIKPNDQKFWIQLRLVLIYDENNLPKGTIGTLVDVTQLKNTEIKLKHANKVKDDFLSLMSHEIRTPLNAVIGMSDILLLEKHLPGQLENLQVLKYSSEHLLALVNDLLNLNKIKAQQITIVEEPFNVLELIEDIRLNFKQVAKNKNLIFRNVIGNDIPSILKGDKLKLSQVLRNLLSNAFKFTPKGKIVFRVELIDKKTTASTLRFSVEDTGIGVSYNKQKDIFKSFVQASDNTETLYGGSGLGLYISSEILKLQNSDLQLKSSKGKGSKFWFDIAYSHSNKETKNRKKIITNKSPVDIKVLVAEDNKLNALLLKKILKKWNIDCVIVENGQLLLEEFTKRDFDLILMDLQMPVLDGYQTAKAIRKLKQTHKASIPIIALTAFTEFEVAEKIKRYKFDGYLSKPLDINNLHKLLESYNNNNLQYSIA